MIKKALTLIFLSLIGFYPYIFGDLFIVTNTQDSGPGSLRQAILDSNGALATLNNIHFNIPGSGTHIIIPLSDLPDITHPVIIDGYTQPGSSPATEKHPALIAIEIQGTHTLTAGLNLATGSDHSIIRGLAINSCTFTPAIQLLSDSNTIEGSFIGTDAQGEVSLPNFNGIQILSSNNLVGGHSPAQRNVIAGTNQLSADTESNTAVVQPGNNIFIAGNSNSIQGNYIGINKFGNAPIGFSDIGIFIRTGDGNLIGGTKSQGNVISGNLFAGILVGYNRSNPLPITNTVISGNLIGTNAKGKRQVPNGHGIAFFQNSSNTLIGGLHRTNRNIISGNHVNGIILASHWQGISSPNFGGANSPLSGPTLIQGNIIGLDITGRKPLGNRLDGILLGEGTNHTLIGGDTKAAGNIISGNHRNGIYLQAYANHNVVKGNIIGLNIKKKTKTGNHRFGVQIGSLLSPANDNVVDNNVIVGNRKGSIFIDKNSVNNLVIGNKTGKKFRHHLGD